VLGEHREHLQGHLVRVRHVSGDEFDPAIHERGDEGDIAGEPVELGNDELGLELLAFGRQMEADPQPPSGKNEAAPVPHDPGLLCFPAFRSTSGQARQLSL
jgi:hypothetical protein